MGSYTTTKKTHGGFDRARSFARIVVFQLLLLSSCSIATSHSPAGQQKIISPEQAVSAAFNSVQKQEDGYLLENREFAVEFSSSQVSVRPRRGGPDWSWSLSEVRTGDKLVYGVSVQEVAPYKSAEDTIDYPRGIITERYLAKARSVEQQFVIEEQPELNGHNLIISGRVESNGELESTSKGWAWRTNDGAVSLGDVYVFDSEGVELAAAMYVTADATMIVIDGTSLAEAVYPVTVDPEIGTNDFRISNMGPDGDSDYGTLITASAYNSTNNEYLVVWTSDDNTGAVIDGEIEVYGQRIDAVTGAEVGANDFRISDMGPDGNAFRDALRPRVAYNSTNNEYLVVWQADDGTPPLVNEEHEVFGQRIDGATGAEIGANDFRISATGTDGDPLLDASYPDVAYNSTNNEYLVVWYADDDAGLLVDNELEIYGQRINASTGVEVGADDFRISSMATDGDPTYGALTPKVAYDNQNNQYLVVWYADTNEGALWDNEYEIYGQLLDAATGNEVGPDDFRISDAGPDGSTSYDAWTPDVAFNSTENEYLVVWKADDNTAPSVNDEYEIYGQRIDANTGAEIGDNDFRISDMGADGDTAFEVDKPSVSYNSINNEYLVVWTGDDDSGLLVDEENETYGQRLDGKTGAEIGTNDFRISDLGSDGDANFDSIYSYVEFDANRRQYLVVWSGDDNLGTLVNDENEVFGQFYTTPGPDLSITATDSADPIASGAMLIYTLSVANTNVASAVNLQVTATLPSQVSFVGTNSVGWSCSESAGVVTCTRAFLAINVSSDITVTVTADEDYDGTITNSVSVSSSVSDSNPSDNSASESTVVQLDSDQDGTPNLSDTDDDDDGLTDAEEAALGTDPLVADTDSDGFSDSQEVSDGSSPLDAGSFVELLSAAPCSEWNSFLGMWNIAEYGNSENNTQSIQSSLYDIDGNVLGSETFSIAASGQTDVALHQMSGWTENSYGMLCSTIQGGQPGDVDGRVVHYKYSDESFEFAYPVTFSNGISGSQFVPFNTLQPSLDPADTELAATNWIELTNLDASAQSGTLVFYAEDGSVLSSESLSLDAGARRDISIHGRVGSAIGVAKWQPVDSSAKFIVRNARYVYEDMDFSRHFLSAALLDAALGSGELLVAPLDTRDGSSVLEVANVTASQVAAQVRVYSASGTELSDMSLTLPAYASTHIVMDTVLESTLGVVTVDGSAPQSIVAVVMQYGRTDSGGINYAYSLQAKQALGTTLRGSYNTFLRQGCELLIANATNTAQFATVHATRSEGTEVLATASVTVPANGLHSYDICGMDESNNYGTVRIQAQAANSLVAHIIRSGADDSYRFSTPVRQ